ncbi:MAG: hypothetical protein B7X04_02730 [Parcubacteria group bacterium 21-54-25]|nr:MAG: hypothetical protein B7X04_02730 [Parcubacteria group bacterium 21-54-25]HQU07732.1 hypothetical protein [Candidatus Paceibacterota bacterium]
MQAIKDLLLKHKLPTTRILEIRRICARTASEVIKIEIKIKEIQYQNGQISFLTTPIIKTELLLRKKEITEQLKKQGVLVSLMQ